MYQSRPFSFGGFGTTQSYVNNTKQGRDGCEFVREPVIEQSPPAEIKPDVDLEIAVDVFRCFQDNMDNFCDFTVNVGDTKFNCHKFVLSSCSGFFEALMRTDMKEKSESSCTVKGISPKIFGLILDVIYKGRNVLNEENMLEMWHAATQLQITLLITACEKFVQKIVTVKNYKTILENAEILSSSTVISTVKNVLATCYFDLVSSDNFTKVSLKELLEILQNDQLRVCPDFCVSSVLKWVSAEDNSNQTVAEPLKDMIIKFEPKKSMDFNFGYFSGKMYRRACLNKLLAVIPLQNTSTECLSALMTNDIVTENKNAVSTVNRIAVTRLDMCEQERLQRERYPGYPGIIIGHMYGANTFRPRSMTCEHCKLKNDSALPF